MFFPFNRLNIIIGRKKSTSQLFDKVENKRNTPYTIQQMHGCGIQKKRSPIKSNKLKTIIKAMFVSTNQVSAHPYIHVKTISWQLYVNSISTLKYIYIQSIKSNNK